MSDKKHAGAVRTYVLIAVVLGIITYVEFALVEYPMAWLGQTWTLVWLVALSIVKFLLVILFFMHLKDDQFTYSAFFSSGMLFALGTFIAVSVLFVAPQSMRLLREELGPDHQAAVAAEAAAEAHEAQGLGQEILDDIATDGYSRDVASIADNPPPKNQAFALPLPVAERNTGSYTVGAIQPFAAGAAAVPSTAGTPPAGGETSGQAPAAAWNAELGTATYDAQCMACHQATGQGIPSAFPPLAGHLPEIYNVEGGRDYLIHAVLFGLQGPIAVAGSSYDGVMPAWGQLGDDEIANVLNHELTSWGNDALVQDFQPIQASEVEALRADALSAQDVHALRENLPLP